MIGEKEYYRTLREQRNRCVEMLPKFDPMDDRYGRLLANCINLQDLLTVADSAHFTATSGTITYPETEWPAATINPVEEPVLVEVPKEEPAVPVMPPDDDIPFEQLRAEANEARDKYNIKVGPIMRNYIPEDVQARLTNIPENKRAAFLADLRKAVENAR